MEAVIKVVDFEVKPKLSVEGQKLRETMRTLAVGKATKINVTEFKRDIELCRSQMKQLKKEGCSHEFAIRSDKANNVIYVGRRS
jgi:hypothetical protein